MVNRFLDVLTHLNVVPRAIESLIFTGHCIICGNSSHRCIDICQACEEELPWSNHQCRGCALKLPSELAQNDILCGECLLRPPIFHYTQTVWEYAPPIAQLISAFKYQRKYSYGRVLAELAKLKIASAYKNKTKPELLMAIPLHWSRHLKRGFNQSEYICSHLSKFLGIPIYGGIRRIKPTPAQQSLDANQRQKNIAGAFQINTTNILQGRRVAIVDDVLTTGATASELSRCLLDAGASEIHIWCLARTPL